jgi:hypothetical protein
MRLHGSCQMHTGSVVAFYLAPCGTMITDKWCDGKILH